MSALIVWRTADAAKACNFASLQFRDAADLGIGTGAVWAIRRSCVTIGAGARDGRGYASLTLTAGDG
jgi:hypothetical protein